jgi:hypothetical protein
MQCSSAELIALSGAKVSGKQQAGADACDGGPRQGGLFSVPSDLGRTFEQKLLLSQSLTCDGK